jgi:cytochrome c biogenesis protein CcmG/thiol:disulfide interchange protein DsbE
MQPVGHSRLTKPNCQENVLMEESNPSEPTTQRRGSPAWIAVVVVASLVLVALVYGLIARPDQAPAVGAPVPGFTLTALDGSPLRLEDYRGQVLVVNFFASWCSPCRQEAPAFQQTWNAYREQGVQFVGIAYQDAAAKAQAFLDEYDLTYPSAVDPGSRTARAYGVTGVPETYIIDQQGNLVRHYIGGVTQAELRSDLEMLLSP